MRPKGFTPLEVARAIGPSGALARARLLTGFTLVELLLVIAIISLLSSIVLASLSQARAKARVIRAATDLRQMAQAAARYYLDTNEPPPRDTSSTDDTCERAIFVTSKFDREIPGGSGIIVEDPPDGWDGPYLITWPPDPWSMKYSWTFSGGGVKYSLITNLPHSSDGYAEAKLLHDQLDSDGEYFDGIARIGEVTSGCPTDPDRCRYKLMYEPFQSGGQYYSLLPTLDLSVIEDNYPRAKNCGV